LTASAALLVEVDTFMPGWHVFVDGQEQPILQANVFGRAVVIPVGTHTVDWKFRPRLVIASLLASWLGLGIVDVEPINAGDSPRLQMASRAKAGCVISASPTAPFAVDLISLPCLVRQSRNLNDI
jgi:hypothetical protein